MSNSIESHDPTFSFGANENTSSGTLSDDSYIENAYQTLLGRSSDANGKAQWLQELHSGHVDRASLLTSFSASAEGLEHLALVGVSTVTHNLNPIV